jgi:hypothetical protein
MIRTIPTTSRTTPTIRVTLIFECYRKCHVESNEKID